MGGWLYKKKGERGHDPLFKLRPFLTHLINNFKASYTLNREVSVDESMIGFKGRLNFIQYMPKKPTKWGIKAYVLSDAHTGYIIYDWHLYTGILDVNMDNVNINNESTEVQTLGVIRIQL